MLKAPTHPCPFSGQVYLYLKSFESSLISPTCRAEPSKVPGAQGDEEGLGEAQEHQEDTLEAEDKVAGH